MQGAERGQGSMPVAWPWHRHPSLALDSHGSSTAGTLLTKVMPIRRLCPCPQGDVLALAVTQVLLSPCPWVLAEPPAPSAVWRGEKAGEVFEDAGGCAVVV